MKKEIILLQSLLFVLVLVKPALSSDKPNIILILTDQWRGQAIGMADEDQVLTPRLDELATGGVMFRNAYTVRAICGPSRASIMTGQYPITTGVYGNSVRMSTESETLGTVAKANECLVLKFPYNKTMQKRSISHPSIPMPIMIIT